MSDTYDFEKAPELLGTQLSQNDTIELLRQSPEFFIQFFLGEELTYAVPEFHIETFNLITIETIIYLAVALPRGHAKTTLSKLACVWYLLFTDLRFIVYVSNTSVVAAEACKDIIAYIRSANFISVFGEARFEVDREGHGYYKFWLQVPDGITGGFKNKFCILKALGAGQQVRGLNIDNERPQMAVVDDLEDNENTGTPALQKKLKLWFYGAFLKALSKKRRKVVYLGNMLSNQSILYHICEKSTQWHSIRKGCILANEQPLWPDMWPVEHIRADFVEYQKLGLVALWFAEMMNMPMAEGTALITPEEITYLPMLLPSEVVHAFITIDIALTAKTWGNETAIAIHAYSASRWQIPEVIHGKFELEKLFYLIIELCQRWHTRIVGIESGAIQLGVRPFFEILMKASQQNFELKEVPHHNASKVSRLSAWCAAIRKQLWCLTEGDHVITQQLLNFDPLKSNNIDDVIDACSMGPYMTELYMADIMSSYTISDDLYRITHVVNN